MKVAAKWATVPLAFTPIEVTLMIESAEELDAFKALSWLDVSVPNAVRTDARDASQGIPRSNHVRGFLICLRRALEAYHA